MRPLAFVLVGLLGAACTDGGKDDETGATTDDTGTSADLDADADDTGDAPDNDLDDDGFDGGADGDDCDDDDATVYPGAEEVAYDGIDQDCDGADLTDVDGDGYDGGDAGDDCNDDDATVNPGAEEVAYDGIDQDCDDADLTDVDGDGYDGGDEGDDCDDDDATVNPGAEEVAYDGIDQDCDDADLTDVDGDGFDGGEEGDDCDDADATIYPGAEEVAYDGIDQDCDDADLTDVDADGFDGGEEGDDCDDADATIYPGADEVPYDGIDQDCDEADLTDVDGDGADGGEEGTDCNDDDAAVYPDAEDTADLVDSDCDGLVDDDAIAAGDIILNEAMVNPDVVDDEDGEWIELYNTTDFDINISGWTITDDGGETGDLITIDGDLVIAAGGYAVLGTNGDIDTNGGVEVDYVYSYGNLRLANTDDELVVSMGDTEIYGIAWVAADWPYARGYAMGWDGVRDWTSGDSWCAQATMLTEGDYGTPGAENDSCFDYTCALDSLSVGVDADGDGVIESGGTYSGDTTDSENNFEHDCGSTGESGPDDAYSFTAAEDGCYNFYLDSAVGWSPVLSVQIDCSGGEIEDCGDSEYLGYSYDPVTGSWAYSYGAEVNVAAAADETFMVVVDGANMTYSDWGTYNLTVSETEPALAPDVVDGDLGSATGDGVATGTTVDAPLATAGTCDTDSGSLTYTWTSPSDGCWFFDTSESGYDTKLAVHVDGGACGYEEYCNDDYPGYSYRSGLEVDLDEGETVVVLVGGWSDSEGEVTLDINPCETAG